MALAFNLSEQFLDSHIAGIERDKLLLCLRAECRSGAKRSAASIRRPTPFRN